MKLSMKLCKNNGLRLAHNMGVSCAMRSRLQVSCVCTRALTYAVCAGDHLLLRHMARAHPHVQIVEEDDEAAMMAGGSGAQPGEERVLILPSMELAGIVRR
jgi:hypothetical protein